jgi:uncharacterized membrane-anchored protein YjiN (DUF445 family)
LRKGQRAQSKKVEAIAQYILEDENKEEIIAELKRYKREFFNIPDYNYYRYGKILPYYPQIRDFYKEHGFAYNEDNELLCEDFCYHVGKAIDKILEENKQ